jgi:hypothetical protein
MIGRLQPLFIRSDLWENRELGNDEKYVRVSSKDIEDKIDEGLGLQMVSMRLPKEAVLALKALAREQGLGYQPFVRQILMNYIKKHEKKDFF